MSSYSEDDVNKLNPRGHVRLRPNMYFGGTDKQGLHRLLFWLLEYPIEDAILGACSRIDIALKPESVLVVSSNGNTFPVEIEPSTSQRFLELLFTRHGIQKSYTEPSRYKVTSSLHGVFMYALNALSKSLTVTAAEDGYLWQQSYAQGLPVTPLEQVRALAVDEATGNVITFRPDFTIFEANEFNFDLICQQCREFAYQVAGLTIAVRDERSEPSLENIYQYSDGLAALVRDVNKAHIPIHEPVAVQQAFTLPRYADAPIKIEIAFEFNESNENHIFSFSNTIHTLGGGTHVSAVQSAITSFFNNCRLNTERRKLLWSDIAPGLTFAVSVRHPFPQIESQTESRLINPEVYGIVSGLTYQMCHDFYAGKHTALGQVLDKCLANHANRTKDVNDDDLLPP
jgi:DNA gyrase subunit B